MSEDQQADFQNGSSSVEVKIFIPEMKTGLKSKNHTSIIIENDIYLFGGEDQKTNEPINKLFIYKIKSGYLKSIDVAKLGATPPIVGGCIFTYDPISSYNINSINPNPKQNKNLKFVSFGGLDFDDFILPAFSILNLDDEKWENDVKMNGTWEVPGQRYAHSCVQIGNDYYFYGGYNAESKLIGGVWKYDTEQQLFSYIHPKINKGDTEAKIPGPSAYHAACAYGNDMLIFGGNTVSKEENLYIYRYDTKTRLWKKPIPVEKNIYLNGVSHHKMVTIGNIIAIVGGLEPIVEIEENIDYKDIGEKLVFYDMSTNQWIKDIKLDGKLGNRAGHTLHAINDQLWVIGGDSDNLTDQDIVVLKSKLFSEQDIKSVPFDLVLYTNPLDTSRETFPPPKSSFDSVIINFREGVILNKWYGDRKQKWRLLYRGTRDGFHAANWHSKVDLQGPTISLVKVGNYIFGGYTPLPWNTSGADQFDDDSWIFSLKNAYDNNQYKFNKIPQSVKKMRSVYHASGYGLWFGANDILIYSNANSNTSSNACLGKSYEYTLSYDANTFFCGNAGFKVDEIETFALNDWKKS